MIQCHVQPLRSETLKHGRTYSGTANIDVFISIQEHCVDDWAKWWNVIDVLRVELLKFNSWGEELADVQILHDKRYAQCIEQSIVHTLVASTSDVFCVFLHASCSKILPSIWLSAMLESCLFFKHKAKIEKRKTKIQNRWRTPKLASYEIKSIQK